MLSPRLGWTATVTAPAIACTACRSPLASGGNQVDRATCSFFAHLTIGNGTVPELCSACGRDGAITAYFPNVQTCVALSAKNPSSRRFLQNLFRLCVLVGRCCAIMIFRDQSISLNSMCNSLLDHCLRGHGKTKAKKLKVAPDLVGRRCGDMMFRYQFVIISVVRSTSTKHWPEVFECDNIPRL